MDVPYKIVPLNEAFQLLSSKRPLFFDTETCGLYGKVRLAQFYQEEMDCVLLVEWPDQFQLMAYLNKFEIVMQNAHYDITVLQQETETRWIPPKFQDTFLLARLALPTQDKFDLDTLATVILRKDVYRSLDKKKLQKTNWAVAKLSEDQLKYAALDVYVMPDIYNAVKHKQDDFNYLLDILTLRYCLDFQWNGMPVCYENTNKRYADNLVEIDDMAMPINVNSWQQVRPYIGEDESDDLALATFALQGNEKAAAVRKTRKLIKQNSFLKKYLEKSDDGNYYGKFQPSARSGRLTSKDENLQQIPRKTKDCFGVEDGWIIYADYAQLELRTICAITACSLMAEKFKEGIDLHDFTTEMIFGKGWTKNQRQLTKTANFNFLYGGGVPVFRNILITKADLMITDREGYSLRKQWRNLWQEIYRWQEKGIHSWKQGRLWSTPLGRKYKGKLMTDHLNIQNQGAGGEVAKLALHYMMQEKKPESAQLRNFIHDSYIWTADNLDEAKELAQIVADKMQEAWTEMSKLFQIKDLPMPVNVRVGKNWGDIENDIFEWELNQ